MAGTLGRQLGSRGLRRCRRCRERFSDLNPALGYGIGVRWRTPAGPLAIDLAWGERFQQLRVQFSVAIAF